MGKIYERIITKRLQQHLENNNLISQFQFGFRAKRSTTDAIQNLINAANTPNFKYAAGLFIDISGAFDNVWWPTILTVLRELEVPSKIYQNIKSYLSDRSVTLENDGEKVTRNVNMGCPQGSVLGPVLWNVTFDKLLKLNYPPNTTVIAFADDVAFVICGNSRRDLENKGNQIMNILSEWAFQARMTISEAKTNGILLRGKLDRGRPPAIKYRGRSVAFVNSVKYLGILLDRGLSFLENTKYSNKKAFNLFSGITRLVKLKYGVKFQSLNHLYKTVYVPIVSYAARVWAHKLNNHKIVRVYRETQRRILKSITGAYQTTSMQALCCLTQNLPIYHKIQLDLDLQDLKKGNINGTKKEIEIRYHEIWQNEWDNATTGRFTYDIFYDLVLVQMANIQIDHKIIQLLTGHGAFKNYLFKHNKTPSPECLNCHEEDNPTHAILECKMHDVPRQQLINRINLSEIEKPYDLKIILRAPELNRYVFGFWKEIFDIRNL